MSCTQKFRFLHTLLFSPTRVFSHAQSCCTFGKEFKTKNNCYESNYYHKIWVINRKANHTRSYNLHLEYVQNISFVEVNFSAQQMARRNQTPTALAGIEKE